MERQRGDYGRRYLGLLAVWFLSGCSSIQYVAQATRGQMELWNRAEPLSKAAENEHVPLRIRKVLRRVPEIRDLLPELGLKGTSNYQDYVQLNRPAVTWLVTASKPLGFTAKQFQFPIVGSFTYIGFFDRDRAIEEATRWNIPDEWESDVRGVRAYSTLGWFRDPLLSTMFPEDEAALGELAHLLIHESVHATSYVKGQSTWNESLAEFFADQTIERVLARLVSRGSPEWIQYFDSKRRDVERRQWFYQTYLDLKKIYESDKNSDEKIRLKSDRILQLKSKLKTDRNINNATLIQFKTYHSGESDFLKFWNHCGKDPVRFIRRIQQVNSDWFKNEQTEDFSSVLDRLIESGECA